MVLGYSKIPHIKEKQKRDRHEYYLKNKKAYARRSREYVVKNREKINKQARERRAKNPEKHRAYQRNWSRKNPDKTQRYFQTYVSKPGIRKKRNAQTKKWEKENPEKVRLNNQKPERKRKLKKWYENNRIDCLKIYSKKVSNSSESICSSCGLKDVRFLQIDHINGVTTNDGRGASNLVNYLRRNDYPDGYQVLCGNCNWLKHFEGKKKTLSTKKENVMKRELWQKLKKEVFTHYSKGKPKCNCCGFDNFTALSIDHISGRKEAKHRKTDSGRLVYYWLRRNHYPKDFQVLCMMCNLAKHNLEKCPHQK